MASVAVSAENLDEFLSREAVVIDFWAEWCGPCRQFAPVFEKVSDQFPGVAFGKVDTELSPEIAASFGVTALPTVLVLKRGEPVHQQAGAMPEGALRRVVESVGAEFAR